MKLPEGICSDTVPVSWDVKVTISQGAARHRKKVVLLQITKPCEVRVVILTC